MDTADTIIRERGGIATRTQLIEAGLTGPQITFAVREGRIRRVRRAYYATRGSGREQCAAVRLGGRLGCLSAAASYGLWGGDDDRVHVAVPRNASRLRTSRRLGPEFAEEPLEPDSIRHRVVLHWTEVDVTAPECWRVTVRDALRQVVRCQPTATAGAVLDSALFQHLVTAGEIAELFEGGFRWERRVASHLFPASASGTESRVARWLAAERIAFRQQVPIPGLGDVDFVLPKKVIVEVDGYAYHSSPERFENDRRRDAVAASLGYLTLRFSYLQVVCNWPFVERTIRETLARR